MLKGILKIYIITTLVYLGLWCLAVGIGFVEQKLNELTIDIVPPGANIFVNDTANLLSSDTEKYITKINDALAPTGAQVVVVTIKSLNGASLEDYATALFNSYGIGDKTKNNGVLFLLALEDRASRIEVGLGLEGVLSDGKTGRIQDKYMIPHFRADSWDEGILGGFNAVVSEIAAEYKINIEGFGENSAKNYTQNYTQNFAEQNATTKNAEQNATAKNYEPDPFEEFVEQNYTYIIITLSLFNILVALFLRAIRKEKIAKLQKEVDEREKIIKKWRENGQKGALPKWAPIKEPASLLASSIFAVIYVFINPFAYIVLGALGDDEGWIFLIMVVNLAIFVVIVPTLIRKYNDNGSVRRSSSGRGGGSRSYGGGRSGGGGSSRRF